MKRINIIVFLILLDCLLVFGIADAQKVVLEYWTWHPLPQYTDEIISEFQKEYPDIQIKQNTVGYTDHLVRLKTAFAAGSEPDLVGLEEGFMQVTYASYLEPLNTYAENTWGQNWEEKFDSMAVEFAKLGDPNREILYSFPMSIQSVQIWYNKQLFEKAGLTGIPQTYDELKEYASKLKSAEVIPFIMGAKDPWKILDVYLPITDVTAPGIFEKAEFGEEPFTHPGLVKALEVMVDMSKTVWQEGAFGLSVYPGADTIFNSGKAAMYPTGTWSLSSLLIAPPDVTRNWDVFYFPALEAGERAARPAGGIDLSIGITKNCTNKEAAWKFINYYVERGMNIYWSKYLNDIPALKAVQVFPEVLEYDEHKQLVTKLINSVSEVTIRRHLVYPEIVDALTNAIAAACLGEKTPEEAMATVEEVSKKIER